MNVLAARRKTLLPIEKGTDPTLVNALSLSFVVAFTAADHPNEPSHRAPY